MKEIVTTIYQAWDGENFTKFEACREYENKTLFRHHNIVMFDTMGNPCYDVDDIADGNKSMYFYIPQPTEASNLYNTIVHEWGYEMPDLLNDNEEKLWIWNEDISKWLPIGINAFPKKAREYLAEHYDE